MTTDYYRTPQQARSLRAWRVGVAVSLAVLLALLWLAGLGPTTTSCCGGDPAAAKASGSAVPAATSVPAAATIAPATSAPTADTTGAPPPSPNASTGAPPPSPSASTDQKVPAAATPEAAAATGLLAGSTAGATPSPVASVTRVYFDWARFDIDALAAQVLVPLAAQLKSHEDLRAVVAGYHDPSGDPAANVVLARNRAVAVRDFLQAKGVAAARIRLQQSADTTGSGTDREARRAEIRIQ